MSLMKGNKKGKKGVWVKIEFDVTGDIMESGDQMCKNGGAA